MSSKSFQDFIRANHKTSGTIYCDVMTYNILMDVMTCLTIIAIIKPSSGEAMTWGSGSDSTLTLTPVFKLR